MKDSEKMFGRKVIKEAEAIHEYRQQGAHAVLEVAATPPGESGYSGDTARALGSSGLTRRNGDYEIPGDS